jgi:tetratricopeptide (TPR) repeat protein
VYVQVNGVSCRSSGAPTWWVRVAEGALEAPFRHVFPQVRRRFLVDSGVVDPSCVGDSSDAIRRLVGHIHRQFGSYTAAEESLTEAIRLARRDGNDQIQRHGLAGLGYLSLATGSDDQAADAFTRALELALEDGHLHGEAAARIGLAHVLRRRGELTRAVAHYREVDTLAVRLGSRNWRFEARIGDALVSQEADPARAVELGKQALATAEAMGQRTDVARAHNVLAGALARLGDRPGAAEHWDRAIELLTDLGLDKAEDGETSVASISHQRALLDDPRPGAAGDEART